MSVADIVTVVLAGTGLSMAAVAAWFGAYDIAPPRPGSLENWNHTRFDPIALDAFRGHDGGVVMAGSRAGRTTARVSAAHFNDVRR